MSIAIFAKSINALHMSRPSRYTYSQEYVNATYLDPVADRFRSQAVNLVKRERERVARIHFAQRKLRSCVFSTSCQSYFLSGPGNVAVGYCHVNIKYAHTGCPGWMKGGAHAEGVAFAAKLRFAVDCVAV